MTKVEQARDIFTTNEGKSRKEIIKLIIDATNSCEAYASTLYNKARKAASGNVVTKSKSPDKKKGNDEKESFIKNCHKIQGLKANHYGVTVDGATVVGVNKNKNLVCVKSGTKTKVTVDTKKVMTKLRKMKFLGKK